eukprot:11209094-Lingulodinium_polyedra.AAC.1
MRRGGIRAPPGTGVGFRLAPGTRGPGGCIPGDRGQSAARGRRLGVARGRRLECWRAAALAVRCRALRAPPRVAR